MQQSNPYDLPSEGGGARGMEGQEGDRSLGVSCSVSNNRAASNLPQANILARSDCVARSCSEGDIADV